MTKEQLQGIRRHFIAYANGFISKAGDMRHMMELKREHCAFVARNCRELAASSSWSQQDVNTAEALGFLHDIGRFPQLDEYGTFMDAKSINHGERGWQALQESNVLEGLGEELRAALLNGVRHHNARTIPSDLPDAHLPWVNLIRDADRLDIYRVVLDALENDQLEEHPEIGLGLSMEGDPSPEVVETIRAKKAPAYTDLNNINDFLLLILSWINLMGYPATLKMMRDRRIIERFSNYLPTDIPEIGALLNDFQQTVDDA